MSPPVSLEILICDPDDKSRSTLMQELKKLPSVAAVYQSRTLREAIQVLGDQPVNAMFIDPRQLDLERASDFIFSIRQKLPHIVFCLHVERTEVERTAAEFYEGTRSRFRHYYLLDKDLAIGPYRKDLGDLVSLCISDVRVLNERLERESHLPAMHDVFVSYATPDKQVADAIVHHLEFLRIRCFIAPRNILPGIEWRGQLEEGIKKSKVFVLVLSGHSNISEPCRKEIFTAAEAGLNILQFRLQKVELHPDLAFELRGRHWLDAIDPPIAARITELSSALCALLKHDPNPLPSAAPPSLLTVEPNQEPQPLDALTRHASERTLEAAYAPSPSSRSTKH